MFEGDYCSLVPIKVEAFHDNDSLCRGTGFLYQFREKHYFVSNWHIFTGLDQFGQMIDVKTHRFPNKLRLTVRKPDFPRTSIATIEIERDRTPSWFQHSRGPEVDLACVEFPSGVSEVSYFPANKAGTVQSKSLVIGQEVFVIGYPDIDGSPERLPVWKRGTIASEPNYEINGLPCFFIDATTSKGMSGSPVFGNPISENGTPRSMSLLGVYFAQAKSELNYLGIGVVLSWSTIEEMIVRRIPGLIKP